MAKMWIQVDIEVEADESLEPGNLPKELILDILRNMDSSGVLDWLGEWAKTDINS
jgi:hypothetical protein